jgi:hypothetical protein
MASEDSFISELAAAQQRRRDLLENGGMTEEEARLAARDEAMGEFDPHADEAGPIWHILSNVVGALMLGLGLGFFIVQVSEPRTDGKSPVDDPSALVPLIFGVTGFFLFFASLKWLYADQASGRLAHLCDSCNPNAGPKPSTTKVGPASGDLESQQALTADEALLRSERDRRAAERKERERKEAEKPKTILFANDRVLLLLELFDFYCRDVDGEEIGCNGLAELMGDCMMQPGDEPSLQDARAFMDKIDLDGDKQVQRNEYLEFMLQRWAGESPIAPAFNRNKDTFIVKLHHERIILPTRASTSPRPAVIGPTGIPTALAEESSLGIDASTETGSAEHALLLREIVKDLFKW